MNQTKDPILRRLIEKKKELLLLFLAKSQATTLNVVEKKFANLLEDREILLEDLKKNDEAINQRENELNCSGQEEEKELVEEIVYLIQAINGNDKITMEKLSIEKNKLGKELQKSKEKTQIVGYLKQGKQKRR